MAINLITNNMLGSVCRAILNQAITYINTKRNGFVDYNDSTTATTPITPSSDTWTKLTNDSAGSFTLTDFLPNGVTSVWDSSADEFDFSDLANGDMISIRADVEFTTDSPNTEVGLRLSLAIGGTTPYTLQLGSDTTYKTAGTYQEVVTENIYIGNDDTRLNPAEVQVIADNASTDIKVNGWAVFIWRNGF